MSGMVTCVCGEGSHTLRCIDKMPGSMPGALWKKTKNDPHSVGFLLQNNPLVDPFNRPQTSDQKANARVSAFVPQAFFSVLVLSLA
jgi:hypothetical protein